jgi:hypothetical protein
MKKIILLLSVMGISFISYSQVEFGIKAGLNYSSLTLSTPVPGWSYHFIAHFNAGIFASIPLSNKFYLQPEAVYSEQGAGASDLNTASYNTNLKYDYNYLNIPVLFKYQDVSGLFAETGPQLGLLLSAQSYFDFGQTRDLKSRTEAIDFSWAFGVGYKLPKFNMGIDVRYNLGFTKILKDPGDVDPMKNSVFQLDLFYPIGRL